MSEGIVDASLITTAITLVVGLITLIVKLVADTRARNARATTIEVSNDITVSGELKQLINFYRNEVAEAKVEMTTISARLSAAETKINTLEGELANERLTLQRALDYIAILRSEIVRLGGTPPKPPKDLNI